MFVSDELMIEGIVSSAHEQVGRKELKVDRILHGMSDKYNSILIHNLTLVHCSNGHS